jgi:hypothetical protein
MRTHQPAAETTRQTTREVVLTTEIVPGLKIGATVDSDADGQPDAMAEGDDNDTTGDDEDGIASFPEFRIGQATSITVSVMNTTGSAATLYSFFDWNNDGDFGDTGEFVSTSVPNNATSVVVNLTVPATAVPGADLGARFRLTTDNLGTGNAAALGGASDGEVEDYLVSLFTDPLGYFYCVETGEIIPGGLISVSGPTGPETMINDGSTGYYNFEFDTGGTEITPFPLLCPPDLHWLLCRLPPAPISLLWMATRMLLALLLPMACIWTISPVWRIPTTQRSLCCRRRRRCAE